uniref:Ig-like domain-containing protein n=1 Tax=Mola mola TaxID=94237 RepID=A0A3Q3WVQ8_MOLML
MAVSTTQEKVTAPASLNAVVGHPLLLGCNITTSPGNIVSQVRWHSWHNKILIAYKQSVQVRISHQDPNVQLTASLNNASYITIKKVEPDHEGCYRCVFDIFPDGMREGKTCVSVSGKIHLEGNRTAVSGRLANLSCWYNLPERVHQVLWRKTAEQGDTTTVASCTKDGHQSITEPFVGRVGLSRNMSVTQLTVRSVRTEDEGCYTCEFHTYPDGMKKATTCLSVYVLPKTDVTHVTSPSGVTEVNCTAQSRPAAEITWKVEGDNRTLGPPVLSVYEQGDGTTIVTSMLLFQSGLLSDRSVKCIVHHLGLTEPLTMSLDPDAGPAWVIVLSVCGVAAVLLLCLCVCLCKCFICANGESRFPQIHIPQRKGRLWTGKTHLRRLL